MPVQHALGSQGSIPGLLASSSLINLRTISNALDPTQLLYNASLISPKLPVVLDLFRSEAGPLKVLFISKCNHGDGENDMVWESEVIRQEPNMDP